MLEHIKPFNFILACDSYKVNHYLELPEHVQYSYTTVVPRKPSKFATKIVALGQTMIAHMFASVRITQEMVDEAEIEIVEQGYSFNREGWQIIVNEKRGVLPLAMYGVEEGRIVDPQTPIIGIVNTDPRFAWLPAYVETFVQSTAWKMSTVASTCRAARVTIKEYMERTGADLSMLNFKLHNFGDRGADSPEEAAVLAGIAHAALFDGSDCTRANGYIKALYGTTKAYTSSVEATEHSVMCSNSDALTKDDFGAATMAVSRLKKVVERTQSGIGVPLLSVVIDTYDSRRFVREYMGGRFKDEIINSGGVMVFRPDSGDPTVEPSMVARDVEATFGVTVNDKGYKVLHPATSIIQGDGVRIDTLDGILKGFTDAGYSMDSFVVGMGGGITHEGSRDSFSFSMKATAISYDGINWVRLLKEPKTDVGKKSLTGLVRCYEENDGQGSLTVVDAIGTGSAFVPTAGWQCWYRDGDRKFKQTFDSVREFARA